MFSPRPVQRATQFEPGVLGDAYYNDLAAGADRSPEEALGQLAAVRAAPERLNPVTVAQLGLAAWSERSRDARWEEVARTAAELLVAAADDDGLIAYRFAMPHTYALAPPWHSAMAQGQAASLFMRLGLHDAAQQAVEPLLAERPPLVVRTPDGPVLQEYPTAPPAHVLNGWIFALFGLYDVSLGGDDAAAKAFAAGAAAVAARIGRYETLGGWSRYDLYPRRPANVASPFYHRLHIELLHALVRLAPDERLTAAAERFTAADAGTVVRGVAIGRKALFRIVHPRKR